MNVKVKAESPQRELVLELRGVICHMGSQYYQLQVNAPRLNPSQ